MSAVMGDRDDADSVGQGDAEGADAVRPALHPPTAALLQRLHTIEKVAHTPDVTMAQLKHAVGQLVEQLRGVVHLVEERAVLEDQLVAMQEHVAHVVADGEGRVKEVRMEMLENRVQLRSVEAALQQAHEQDVLQRATELLDRRTREVNEQNFDLIKDKLLLTRDVEAARERGAVLERQHDTWRREAELAAAAQTELVARSVRQRREIAALKRQVKTLEDGALQVAQSYEARLAAQRQTHESEVRRVHQERDEARARAQTVSRELVKVRGLAEQLVQQRGDLDAFFYAALTEVRHEILQERRRALAALPPHHPTHTLSSTLRLESQPSRRLLLTDRRTPRRQWSTDRKGLPALLEGPPYKELPPIPHLTEGENAASTRRQSSALSTSRQASATRSSGDAFEEVEVGLATLRTATTRPTLRELQEVDVARLSWTDKERVLRYLFQRLRRRGKANAGAASQQHDVAPSSDETPELYDDSCTFLTQNGL